VAALLYRLSGDGVMFITTLLPKCLVVLLAGGSRIFVTFLDPK
jgi:hypothetical protein